MKKRLRNTGLNIFIDLWWCVARGNGIFLDNGYKMVFVASFSRTGQLTWAKSPVFRDLANYQKLLTSGWTGLYISNYHSNLRLKIKSEAPGMYLGLLPFGVCIWENGIRGNKLKAVKLSMSPMRVAVARSKIMSVGTTHQLSSYTASISCVWAPGMAPTRIRLW